MIYIHHCDKKAGEINKKNNTYFVHKIYQRQKEENLDNIYWEINS